MQWVCIFEIEHVKQIRRGKARCERKEGEKEEEKEMENRVNFRESLRE